MDSIVCSLKSFQGEKLNVCLCGYVVCYGIVSGLIGLNLFELVHKGCCIVHALLVGRVQAFRQDLIDHIVIACQSVVSFVLCVKK